MSKGSRVPLNPLVGANISGCRFFVAEPRGEPTAAGTQVLNPNCIEFCMDVGEIRMWTNVRVSWLSEAEYI